MNLSEFFLKDGEPACRSLYQSFLFLGSSSGSSSGSPRKWKLVASENDLWSNLFKQRWGIDRAVFYAPVDSSKSWKDVYAVQDRCDRVGLGLKIIREGDDYFLIHQGQIQKHLGSRSLQPDHAAVAAGYTQDEIMGRNERQMGILDRILFFIGDLETASAPAKRGRHLL